MELRRASELMPADSSVHYMLSQTLGKLGKRQEAQQEAETAEGLGRKEKETSLAIAYAQQGLFLIQQGKPQEALVKLQEARRMGPDNLGVQFDYAVGLRQLHRFDESIVELEKILQKQPDLPGAHYQLGCNYFQKGRFGEAVTAFADAARLIPGTAEVHNGLGVALAKSNDYARAVAELEMAHRLESGNKLYIKNLNCVRQRLSGCTVSL